LPANSLPPFLLTSGVLLLVGGLFLAVRRARHASPSRPPTPTAHDPDAVDPLATLVDDYRRGICPGDQLIIRLDGLVRDTLAARSGIPARSLTSVELRQALSTAKWGAFVGAASAANDGPANAFAPEGAPTSSAPPSATVLVGAASAANPGATGATEIGPQLARFLALGDRVKFAAHRPDALEIDDALRLVAGLLEAASAGQAP
jgi:hypothetical protein